MSRGLWDWLRAAGCLGVAALMLAVGVRSQTFDDAPNFWGVTVGNGTTVLVGDQGAIWVGLSRGGGGKASAGAPIWLLGVTYGAGKFVAVGAGGAVLTSTDAFAWVPSSSGVKSRLQNVAFGDGLFVAVSDAGDIIASLDAITWNVRSSGTTSWLRGLTRGGGLWVATGANGTVLTSPDSVTWTRRTTGVTTGLDAVLFGQRTGMAQNLKPTIQTPVSFEDPSRYVVVGEGGTTLVSTDGITWQRGRVGSSGWLRSVGMVHWRALGFAGGIDETGFYTLGDDGLFYTSEDGLGWLPAPLASPPVAPFSIHTSYSTGTTVYGFGASGASCSISMASEFPLAWSVLMSTSRWSTPALQGHRFVNLATRGTVGASASPMIAGFVISGDSPSRCLVRAVGPSLAAFGVTGTLSDPQLTLFDNKGAVVATNDNWGGTVDVRDAAQTVGAFPLAAASSDAAVIVTLPPGSYTAQVSGVNNSSGVALVEVYELP